MNNTLFQKIYLLLLFSSRTDTFADLQQPASCNVIAGTVFNRSIAAVCRPRRRAAEKEHARTYPPQFASSRYIRGAWSSRKLKYRRLLVQTASGSNFAILWERSYVSTTRLALRRQRFRPRRQSSVHWMDFQWGFRVAPVISIANS